ncbi:hypothetical protein H5395_16725 [Paracoccus sp. MC1854]|nr:hypothetical protein [Paracoccus sp. MC1854]
MMGATRPSDWTEPKTEPCCYMDAVEIARARGIPASTWRRYEAQLAAARLIERRTAANGARSRWTGTGIFFGPLLAQVSDLLAMREQAEAERRAHAHLRGRRSIARRHLRHAIEALIELGAAGETVQALVEQRDAWPAAEALYCMTVAELRRHVDEAESLCREALALVENLEKSSGGPLSFERSHIQDTTQIHMKSGNACVDNRSTGKPVQDNPSAAPPNGSAKSTEKNDGAGRAAVKGQFIDRLGPQRLFELASVEMQQDLLRHRSDPGELTLFDFICAAYDRFPHIGLRPRLWEEWAQLMSEEELMLCTLITDARRSDPETPVISPGGYMRGMVRACQLGTLNLTGSLIGLNERRLAEERT